MNRREAIKQQALLVFGTSLSAAVLTDIFTSCSTPAGVSWQPVFFTPTQAALLSIITETILPKTQTPGAIEIGVPQFIDKIAATCIDPNMQQTLVEGLSQINDLAKTKFHKNFEACDTLQKETILTELDQTAGSFPLSLWGITLEKPKPVTFFRHLKSLTLFAYFTSQEIGKGVLRYDPVPGDFLACIPLDGKNSWTE